MLAALDGWEKQGLSALESISRSQELPAWYRDYLGRKGKLTEALRELGELEEAERPQAGRRANEVKRALEQAFAQRQETLREAELQASLASAALDVTLPGRPLAPGHLHLTTRTLRRIRDIFAEIGFQIYESREVETDEYNFELLHIPPYHPARDMWDTFWIDENIVLRTHTSPGQIRCMRENHPQPIRVILPGKCYRYEQITPRSEHQFYQIEGLAVGHGICMTDLIGTMAEATRRMHGSKRGLRVRSSYFPFTEPSIEIDMDCILCHREGCRVCKYSGWLEIAGGGMVHPVVLRNGGYDPAEWSGFAFGMGVERPAMLEHGIEDIRHFYANDLRFLHQF